jgi:hypothetical protein
MKKGFVLFEIIVFLTMSFILLSIDTIITTATKAQLYNKT